MKLLFICSRNKWRSRTAEDIFKTSKNYDVRSAGTAESARIKVNEKLLNWADVIFVMERKHKQRLMEKFHSIMSTKEIKVLDIPDEYQYMDKKLVELLTGSVSTYLDKSKSNN
ncbi:MAG TPA: protein tyrosine phosphatase [Pedobacter sp.]|jgi:protein-tyrosine phosphatase